MAGQEPQASRETTGLSASWAALGSWMGAHLSLIVPAGVALGIALPQLLLPVKPYVPVLFALMTFQNSLQNDLRSLQHAFRRPRMLVVTLALVHLALPAATFVLASALFGPQSPTVAGIVLEYSVPIGASTIMWVGMFGGELSLSLSVLLISTIVSPLTMPATLKLLVGTAVEVDGLGMMRDMALMVAIPALLATVANELTGGRAAEVLAPPTTPLSRILLPLIVATNATGLSGYARNPTPQLLLITVVMLGFALATFLLGMVVARWLSDDRPSLVALSFSCGIRNVTAGAVLASQHFGPEVMFPAIIGTPFQQILAALGGRAMERQLARAYPPAEADDVP